MPLTNGVFADIWNFTRAGTATGVVAGLITGFASGAPRIQDGGLLIESGRTNGQARSDALDDASWSKVSCTVTANASLAPDGTMGMDKIVESAANAVHFVLGPAGAVTSSARASGSVYLKAIERTKAELRLGALGGTTSDLIVTVDLITGALTTPAATGSWSNVSATAVAVGGGIWRCTLSGTTGADVTSARMLVVLSNGSTTGYAGDGVSGLVAWGSQVEVGDFASSYIPTTSAAVTRLAETCQMKSTPLANALPGKRGTIITEVTLSRGGISGFTPAIWGLSDGTANNAIILSQDAGAQTLLARVINGGSTLSLSAGSYTSGVTFRHAIAFGSGQLRLSQNGGAVSGLSAITANMNLSQLDLGCFQGGNQLNGLIRTFRTYPFELSDADLRAQSTVGAAPLLLAA